MFIIFIIHILVSYDQNISLIFFMWKWIPCQAATSVLCLPPRYSTLQYKRCVHLWNNFSCIIIPCVISNIVFITFKISDWHAGLYNIFYLLLLQYTVCFHKQYTNNFRLESHIFKKSWWFSYWCHCNHYCNQFCHQVYFLSFHFKVKYKDFRT